jgi:phosphatidate cytidylyltransferase
VTTVEHLVPYIAGALVAGGIGVGLSGRAELVRRWCAWAVAVPIVVTAFVLGQAGISVLAAAVGIVCVGEYARLARLPAGDQAVLGAGVVALVAASWLAPDQVGRVAAGGVLLVVLVRVVAGDTEAGFHRAAAGVLGLAWFAPLAVAGHLGADALALFAAVSIADIAAYFGGRRLGGPKLSPLSPAKRWSGVLVGAAAGLAVLAGLGALSLPLAVAAALGGPVGDLFESMVKRGAGAKDAGNWLPGSGGVLDRVDSLLMALAVAALLS